MSLAIQGFADRPNKIGKQGGIEFLISKNKLILLSSASVVLGILFLIAGLLIGLMLNVKKEKIPSAVFQAELTGQMDQQRKKTPNRVNFKVESAPKPQTETTVREQSLEKVRIDSSGDQAIAFEKEQDRLKTSYPGSLYPYAIRLASFRSPENAMTAFTAHKRNGLPVYLNEDISKDHGRWHRLYLGYYRTEKEAGKAKNDLNLKDAIVKRACWANLIGIFSSQNELKSDFENLKQLNYFPYIIKSNAREYFLFVSASTMRENAMVINENLRADGFYAQLVRR